MGNVEGQAKESGLNYLEQLYCTTARAGRLAEVGFGVSGEQSLIRLINSTA